MTALLTQRRTLQVLLSLGVLEFFGPIVRDASVTHLLNPAWVGHARFHLMWLLVFMAASGLANLVLVWKVADDRALWTAWAWQACNVLGFWGAAALADGYGGLIVDPEFHMTILGLNENLFTFVVLAALSLVTLGALTLRDRLPEVQRA
ncbi:MAG: hypothetical protein EP330_11115 [Deltaproteobacteria bacterium]|nr:MAG: hypothetical protein EP330_11115 [Deltaproteobacteria bacterium]